MKIAIVTAYYEPIPAPRAFRAAELAREFVRRGYEVSVFNTTSVIRDGVNVSRATGGVKLVNLDIIRMQQDSPKAGNRTKEKWYKSEFRKYLFYFTTNTWLKILFGLKRKLVFPQSLFYFHKRKTTPCQLLSPPTKKTGFLRIKNVSHRGTYGLPVLFQTAVPYHVRQQSLTFVIGINLKHLKR